MKNKTIRTGVRIVGNEFVTVAHSEYDCKTHLELNAYREAVSAQQDIEKEDMDIRLLPNHTPMVNTRTDITQEQLSRGLERMGCWRCDKCGEIYNTRGNHKKDNGHLLDLRKDDAGTRYYLCEECWVFMLDNDDALAYDDKFISTFYLEYSNPLVIMKHFLDHAKDSIRYVDAFEYAFGGASIDKWPMVLQDAYHRIVK